MMTHKGKTWKIPTDKISEAEDLIKASGAETQPTPSKHEKWRYNVGKTSLQCT